MAIASVVQGTIEVEGGKIFELDSSKGSVWLESVTSFRYVPTGANKPYTARKEEKKGGDYWYGYRKLAGKLHKKYIGKSSELNTAKLEEISEALNTPQQPRVTQVTDTVTQVTGTHNQRVTERVTDNHTVERVTALELQVQALQKSLEKLRSALPEKSEGLSNFSKLLNLNTEVTENELQTELRNSQTNEIFTALDPDDIKFLKQENEHWKRLLAEKSPLIPSDLYTEIEKLKERNRQLRLKISSERRDSIEKISELERRTESMMRRNQEKQARLDELEIQIEEGAGSKLQNELGNLQVENETLRADYAKLLESSTHITKLRQEVQELRSRLEKERANQEEVEAEREELAQLKKWAKEAADEVHREGRSIELEKDRWQGELSKARSDLAAANATIVQQEGRIRELERGYSLKPNPVERRLRLEIGELQTELSDLKQKSAAAREDLPEAADLLNQLKAKRRKSTVSLADVELLLEIIEKSCDDTPKGL